MLRRIFDGTLIALVAWFALARLDAGGLAIGIVLAAVIVFTAWRTVKLWRRYKHLLARREEALALQQSDDPAERERAERMLRERGVMYAAEMGIWSGFVLGAAMVDATPAQAAGEGAQHGDGSDYGNDYGNDPGGWGGGDMGGGFGGDMGGGM